MNEWVGFYGWTVALWLICFSETYGDWLERLGSFLMALSWPVLVVAKVLWHGYQIVVNAKWALRQDALIARSNRNLDAAIKADGGPEWQKLKSRLRVIRGWKDYAERSWMYRGRKWHQWLLEEEERLLDVLRRDLIRYSYKIEAQRRWDDKTGSEQEDPRAPDRRSGEVPGLEVPADPLELGAHRH